MMLKKQEGSHILTRIVSLLDFISLHQLQLHKLQVPLVLLEKLENG